MHPIAVRFTLVSAFLTAFAACAEAQTLLPVGPVPSPRQVRWQALEAYAFIHFNMDTFTGREWGEGNEDPALFNPSALDCRQWVAAIKDAGLSGVVITAKHHDGFCLWPSRFSDHTVAQSPWKSGKGDVLRELSDACREKGLHFGVYISPWDRHSPVYGRGKEYDEYFENQLKELLSNYGEIFEVWFDGACGEGQNGKKQAYDFPRYIRTVRTLQPKAVIFSDAGPDIRWVGNERGFAGETNWSMLDRRDFYPGIPGKDAILNTGDPNGDDWLPAECDVSIRPGWYWHAEEDQKTKTVDQLMDIWFGSVGRNANLILNIPVDRRGLVPEADVRRLSDWRKRRDEIFSRNLARGATASADGANALDGDPLTFWSGRPDASGARMLRVGFKEAVRADVLELREPIALGQRIAAFTVRARTNDGNWRTIGEGTTIGNRRLLRFTAGEIVELEIAITAVRKTATGDNGYPSPIAEVGLYSTP